MIRQNLLLTTMTVACMAFSSLSVAAGPVPNVDVESAGDQGEPGGVVHPTWTLAIDGFGFETMDLTLLYDQDVMSFLPAASSFTFNGETYAFNAMLDFLYVDWGGGVDEESFGFLREAGIPVSGSLVLTAAFQIAPTAPSGSYDVTAFGSIATDPVYEERDYLSVASIAVVPEPEVWLLWLAGLGLVAGRFLSSGYCSK